jgi:hypothetical protein
MQKASAVPLRATTLRWTAYGFLLAFAAWWVIIPLDAKRFAWP